MRAYLLAFALSFARATAFATDSPAPTAEAAERLPAEVVAYAEILAAIEQAQTPTSLEPLMRIEGDRAWLERQSPEQFARAREAMRGYVLNTGDDIYALPDFKFYVDLAKRHGRPADVAFFTLSKQAEGTNFLPLYLQEKLPTPCVRYGDRIVNELYEAWSNYTKSYPKNYAQWSKQYLRDLEEVMVLGTCACGNAASVQKDQAEFLRRFPRNPVRKDVEKRMNELKNQSNVQPVNCR
jgi:hypothetical protein